MVVAGRVYIIVYGYLYICSGVMIPGREDR